MGQITLSENQVLVTTKCWCGCRLAVPKELYDTAQSNNDHPLYCPLGHKFYFKENKAERLERQLQRERAAHDQKQARLRDANQSLRDQRTKLEHKVRGQKAANTKLKNKLNQ